MRFRPLGLLPLCCKACYGLRGIYEELVLRQTHACRAGFFKHWNDTGPGLATETRNAYTGVAQGFRRGFLFTAASISRLVAHTSTLPS
ncbi:hypothetical protein BDQ17DRAFT_1361164 [Cyathus striatus]|nr:hypothetical protein BDQ17DRAFT_1379974 [Cyathus striatus]KAF8999323.1 hypothetical protein BDQ17DRAFT_1361164 [Cyathus striatus]